MSALDAVLERLPAKIVIPVLTAALGLTLGLAGATQVFAARVRSIETAQAVAQVERVDILRRLDRIEKGQDTADDKLDELLGLLKAQKEKP